MLRQVPEEVNSEWIDEVVSGACPSSYGLEDDDNCNDCEECWQQLAGEEFDDGKESLND